MTAGWTSRLGCDALLVLIIRWVPYESIAEFRHILYDAQAQQIGNAAPWTILAHEATSLGMMETLLHACVTVSLN